MHNKRCRNIPQAATVFQTHIPHSAGVVQKFTPTKTQFTQQVEDVTAIELEYFRAERF